MRYATDNIVRLEVRVIEEAVSTIGCGQRPRCAATAPLQSVLYNNEDVAVGR
jgi:hypothetical protein